MPSPEEQLRAIVSAGFASIAPHVVDIIRYEIDEAYPPASEPGTPPHRRTGNLQNKIRSQVDEFHDGVTLTFISDAFYSRFLRDRTRKMAARDFFGDQAVERYLPIIAQLLQDYVTANASINGSFNFIESRIDSIGSLAIANGKGILVTV